MTLPAVTPQINVDEYELSRIQSNLAGTTDAILGFLATNFSVPVSGAPVTINAAPTTPAVAAPARCVALSTYDSINGTTAIRPAQLPSAGGAAQIVVMPFAGSVVGLGITTMAAAGGEGVTFTGTLTLSAYKNNAASGASVTLGLAGVQAYTTWPVGTYTFAAGDYFQFWASSASLSTNNVASYNYQLWVVTN